MDNKLNKVLEAIDEINAQDPNLEVSEGEKIPKELLYGQRMSAALKAFHENASEILQIAARGQHIRRWDIPRSDYPMDRKGYLQWRTQLKMMHASIIEEIMKKHSYSEGEIKIAKDLLMKKGLKSNRDAQTLEDVICLVFLKYYIDDFAKGKEEDKMISILQKTWGKMSENGHKAAQRLSLSSETSTLVSKALSA
ncbi:MAG: DUF4202 domain-containing protein [Cyclobacteriaceae bacterium]